MFLDHILQADQGCDFDFLKAVNGPERVAPPVKFKNPGI
jgi:hypothetical protein